MWENIAKVHSHDHFALQHRHQLVCNMVECNYSEKLKNFDGFDQRIKPTYKGPWIRSLVGYEFVI